MFIFSLVGVFIVREGILNLQNGDYRGMITDPWVELFRCFWSYKFWKDELPSKCLHFLVYVVFNLLLEERARIKVSGADCTKWPDSSLLLLYAFAVTIILYFRFETYRTKCIGNCDFSLVLKSLKENPLVYSFVLFKSDYFYIYHPGSPFRSVWLSFICILLEFKRERGKRGNLYW